MTEQDDPSRPVLKPEESRGVSEGGFESASASSEKLPASPLAVRVWEFLGNERNRGILALLGSGAVVVVGGVWTSATYFAEHVAKSEAIAVTISDVTNYMNEVSEPHPGSVHWLLANYIDMLIKIDKRSSTTNCDFIFLMNGWQMTSFVHAHPFSIPSGVTSFRGHFSLTFVEPSDIRTIPFRVTCEGATSNMLSVDVIDQRLDAKDQGQK